MKSSISFSKLLTFKAFGNFFYSKMQLIRCSKTSNVMWGICLMGSLDMELFAVVLLALVLRILSYISSCIILTKLTSSPLSSTSFLRISIASLESEVNSLLILSTLLLKCLAITSAIAFLEVTVSPSLLKTVRN